MATGWLLQLEDMVNISTILTQLITVTKHSAKVTIQHNTGAKKSGIEDLRDLITVVVGTAWG